MRIRAARDADLPAVEDLVRRAYEPYIERIGRRPAPMDDDYAEAIAARRVFVAEERVDAGVLGLLVLIPAGDHLLVENVAVDPARQGKGLGRALLARAETVARRKGLPTLRLYTNAAMHENIALYSSLGWQETGREVVNGFERVFFLKLLDQVTDMLALLGSGAGAEILMALGRGPLRTEELVERIAVYSPRTIYRYLDRLAGIEVIEREEEPGVPSKVTNRLTEPRGVSLYELVDDYARISLDHLPDGGIVTYSWKRLEMLADLWRSDMLGALNAGPSTVTELAQASSSLGFHQVSRRMGLYMAAGLIEVSKAGGRRRRYRPTGHLRRGMALIAGLALWRERGEGSETGSSLIAVETARLLAASLPLVASPEDAGKRFELAVEGHGPKGHGEEVLVWAAVGKDGAIECLADGISADASASGAVDAWLDLMTLGRCAGLRVDGGDDRRLTACLEQLHSTLWKRSAPST
jgi:GNAT superfamily N-acetyltransferase/DNA-binding HxlR family transcriptional regulator